MAEVRRFMQIIGFLALVAGFGMAIFAAAGEWQDRVAPIPGAEPAAPLIREANPLLALGLILGGVVLVALGSTRDGRD